MPRNNNDNARKEIGEIIERKKVFRCIPWRIFTKKKKKTGRLNGYYRRRRR